MVRHFTSEFQLNQPVTQIKSVEPFLIITSSSGVWWRSRPEAHMAFIREKSFALLRFSFRSTEPGVFGNSITHLNLPYCPPLHLSSAAHTYIDTFVYQPEATGVCWRRSSLHAIAVANWSTNRTLPKNTPLESEQRALWETLAP